MTRDLIDGLCTYTVIGVLMYLPWILKALTEIAQ